MEPPDQGPAGKRIVRITLDEQGQGLVGQVPAAGMPEPLGDAERQRGGGRSVDARRQLVAFGQPGEHRLGIVLDMLEDGLHLPPLGKAVQRSAERVCRLPSSAGVKDRRSMRLPP